MKFIEKWMDEIVLGNDATDRGVDRILLKRGLTRNADAIKVRGLGAAGGLGATRGL